MRDFAMNHAASYGEAGHESVLSRLVRNWLARRAVGRLEAYDDHMLQDIGVSRTDVEWAAGLPLSVNAALALEDRSFRRRRHERL